MKFPAGSKRPILPMPIKGEEIIGEEGGVEIPEGTSPLPEAAFSNPDINDATDVETAGGALVTILGGGEVASCPVCGGEVPVSCEYKSF